MAWVDGLTAKELNGIVAHRFQAQLPEATAKALANRLKAWANQGSGGHASKPSNSYVLSWLRNRLHELDVWAASGSENNTEWRTCFLNIGFLGIRETEEQLARLRVKDASKRDSEVARSKMFQTVEIPRPVNRTAIRVSRPGHKGR